MRSREFSSPGMGDLTLHGVTKHVTFPLQAQLNGDVITVTGQLMIQFGDGSSIAIEPHLRVEAWEIQGGGALEGLAYLCQPGGGMPWRPL